MNIQSLLLLLAGFITVVALAVAVVFVRHGRAAPRILRNLFRSAATLRREELEAACSRQFDSNDHLTALGVFLARLERARDNGDSQDELRQLCDVTITQFFLAQHDVAEKYCAEALHLARKLRALDSSITAELYNVWACILQARQRNSEALPWFNAAYLVSSKWAYGQEPDSRLVQLSANIKKNLDACSDNQGF